MYWGDALLQAVGQALAGVITGGVYEQTPQGEGYPYTTIETPTEVPADLHDQAGGSYTVTMHTFSMAPNAGEVEAIASEIDAALHHADLTVNGARCWAVTREFSGPGPSEEEDNEAVTHKVLRYRFDLEEA